ncbi:hypothetical protein EDC04DRAFT_2896053 [Pisolithus marmoratus]|nr:hypothetical protein EDC04DRAFT_2896053 [Pisolithus marmoratus]
MLPSSPNSKIPRANCRPIAILELLYSIVNYDLERERKQDDDWTVTTARVTQWGRIRVPTNVHLPASPSPTSIMAHIMDEEISLLHVQPQNRRKALFPWRQFSIILFLQLAEPLSSQLISPVAPQLIRDIAVTHRDETKVGIYVDLLAYAYTPIAWSSGSTLGPFNGGLLFRPADRFPNVFGRVEFLSEYPYFLACAIPATFTVIAWMVTLLFLKETLLNTVSLRQLIKSRFCQWNFNRKDIKSALPIETLITNENDENKPLLLRAPLIPQMLIAAGNYATLSTINIAFHAVEPLCYATPIELGGLGLDRL